MDFKQILSKFVHDFLGNAWITRVEVKDFAEYVETIGEQGGSLEAGQRPDQSLNK